jgi:flagellar biosynthesis protein FlhG
MNERPAKVYSITSGKGGVGKTHTTVNLGLALVKARRKVLLLDADLGLANINILLNFRPAATLEQVFAGKAALQDIIVSHPAGFDIIPAASGIPELTNLSEAERMTFVAAIDELAVKYDYMLVDTAAGIGDNVLYFNLAAEEIIVVVGPEPTSITDAYALIKVLATRHGRKRFNVVVNRYTASSDPKTVFAQLAKATDKFLNVGLRLIGSIPDDSAVSEAVIQQQPFLDLFPSSKASVAITRLANQIDNEINDREPQGGGFQFFFKALLDARPPTANP